MIDASAEGDKLVEDRPATSRSDRVARRDESIGSSSSSYQTETPWYRSPVAIVAGAGATVLSVAGVGGWLFAVRRRNDNKNM
ncbi:hypothetical protein FQZ97_1090500 [compost metagenome]